MTTPLEGEITIDKKELATLRKQYEAEQPNPSTSTTFNYAWGLVHSNVYHEIELGIALFQQIIPHNPSLRRESRYYVAQGYFKLARFADARNYAQQVLRDHPEDPQARGLLDAIDAQVQKDGLVGMAIVGGAIAAAGLVIGMLSRK
ncbi:mitochondrial membrane protein [Blastocladiella emersonii ATCC 22665]|nr:mitochondrial membrane protein [Blastocladiella emersonii ATCC 22665]